MAKDIVGYRFFPSGEELINYYLKNKNLGKTWLVDEAISEINICSKEPMLLPSLAKIQSDDPVWYFFSPKEYTSAKKKVTKRTTGSGFWKATGVDRKIKDKRGNGVEIGIKKTLVYHEGKVPHGVWTPWVMHEYHITCLPPNQRNYVICQVMYKGEDGDISYGNNSYEPSHSLVSDSKTVRAINTLPEVEQPGQGQGQEDGLCVDDLLMPMNQQEDHAPWDVLDPSTLYSDNNYPNAPQQSPFDDDYFRGLLGFNGGNFEDVFPNQDFMMQLQENRNDHRPKKPLSGIIVDYSSGSESDAESISATSYKATSSPNDSVGSSNRHFPSFSSTDSCKDLQTSADPLIGRKNQESQLPRRTIPSKQEAKEGRSKGVDAESSVVKAEKKGWFITEDAMERNCKNPSYIYLMNLIIGVILLLAFIGSIMSAFLSDKT